jgi:hypothetical protein
VPTTTHSTNREASAKPSRDFPLVAHRSRQGAEKMRGKTHYFEDHTADTPDVPRPEAQPRREAAIAEGPGIPQGHLADTGLDELGGLLGNLSHTLRLGSRKPVTRPGDRNKLVLDSQLR